MGTYCILGDDGSEADKIESTRAAWRKASKQAGPRDTLVLESNGKEARLSVKRGTPVLKK